MSAMLVKYHDQFPVTEEEITLVDDLAGENFSLKREINRLERDIKILWRAIWGLCGIIGWTFGEAYIVPLLR